MLPHDRQNIATLGRIHDFGEHLDAVSPAHRRSTILKLVKNFCRPLHYHQEEYPPLGAMRLIVTQSRGSRRQTFARPISENRP